MKNLSLIIICCLCGCALFQKTSKTTAVASRSSINQLESSQLVLKTAGKETQIFTYWNDSGFYQYQHIREDLVKAQLEKQASTAKVSAQTKSVIREREPVNVWVIAGALGLFIGMVLLFRKFR